MMEEKKVGYIELIYDLVFVYMVGRDTELLESFSNGFINARAFAIYIVCTVSIIQIWNFTTFYINMFGRNSLRDHIFLLLNMYLMFFIGEATRTDIIYISLYHIPWALILANIGLQYVIELRNHKADVWNRDFIQRMAVTLFTEAALVFIVSFLSESASMLISLIAIAVSILLTFVDRKRSAGGQVNFMHLTERAMLYVVLTFGEMIIAVAGFFKGAGRGLSVPMIYYSVFTFLIPVGLFLSYEILYEHLVDREGNYNGLAYMCIHIFILFALNNITASIHFMRNHEVADMPKVMFLAVSVVGYFLFLFLLRGHFKIRFQKDRRVLAGLGILSGVFLAFMALFYSNMKWNIVITTAYTFMVLIILHRMNAMREKKMKKYL